MISYSDYPPLVVEDIARLRRRIRTAGVPPKVQDENLLIATWNIRAFGGFHPEWTENPGSPKRNRRGLACIHEIVRCFDVIAVQEVLRDVTGIHQLLSMLGPDWALILTDVTEGDAGHNERLGFIYDRRRVQPSGLACELVLPPLEGGDARRQFARTPYAVSFRAGGESFVLVALHVLYGPKPESRLQELRDIALWLSKWSKRPDGYNQNLITLGDFNIDRRGDENFQAFAETGLVVPAALAEVPTVPGLTPKHYDQIAWFMGDFDLPETGRAGNIDFSGAVFQELTIGQMSFRMSDHLPLWAEFRINRSVEQMAKTLNVDPAQPDPFAGIPD